MTKHDPTPGHTLATRIASTLYALEAGLPLPQLSAAMDGIAAAWGISGALHYFADHPDRAPLPFAAMQIDGEDTLKRLQQIADHYNIEVTA